MKPWGVAYQHIREERGKEMKKVILAVGASLVLLIGQAGIVRAGEHGPAEHCKESGKRGCGQEVAAMGQQDHSGHEGMHHGPDASKEKLDWAGMSRHLIPMMKSMTGMTQRLAEIMESGMKSEKMTEVGGLMDTVSSHMLRLADVMNNGGASEAEMHSIHMGINETEAKIKQMR